MISSSPRGEGLRFGGDVEHRVVVEVEPGDRVGRRGLAGFSSSDKARPARVELDDAVALRILDAIGEDGGAALAHGRLPHVVGQAVAVEDVVAERQRHAVVADELAADDEGLREPAGMRLRGVRQARPNWLPSPSTRTKLAWSSGVVMISMSRSPPSISVVSG